MKAARLFLAFGAVLLLAVAAASAPKQNAPAVKYDVSTETKIKGTVEEIKDFDCPVTGTVGRHIEVRTSEGLIEVHLAPIAFMNDFGLVINKDDQVVITGSKIVLNGTPTILAREVESPNYKFTFRNEQGRPLW